MNILAFAASNSRQSINKQLVTHAAHLLSSEIAPGTAVEILDLNDFDMPLYSIDREKADGVPAAAHLFRDKINATDALLISFAEHNGSYTAAYKNLFDWASRLEGKVYEGKPAVLLATSPGGGGAASVLETAKTAMPYFGGSVLASLSVPKFFDHFDTERGMLRNTEIKEQLAGCLRYFFQQA